MAAPHPIPVSINSKLVTHANGGMSDDDQAISAGKQLQVLYSDNRVLGYADHREQHGSLGLWRIKLI